MNARSARARPSARARGGGGRQTLAPLASALLLLARSLALALGSTACLVGPNYERPRVDAPGGYREGSGWKAAEPKDELARGAWWKVFGDPVLDELEARVSVNNQQLALAEAQYREPRASVRLARAGYFPTVTASVGVTRSHQPTGFRVGSAATAGAAASATGTTGSATATTATSTGDLTIFSLPVELAWEADVWGRIRRTVESNVAAAQASAGDLESARLSAQATLAQDYFQLRALDAQKEILSRAAADLEKFLELTQNRYRAGVASQADVLQAEGQLQATLAQAIDVGVQRAELEHAVAVLTGRPPTSLALDAAPLAGEPPATPLYLPSELLERRPDVAAAERRVAAANAQIGVALAAFFPHFTLSASAGFQSSSLSDWLTSPSFFWSVGPGLAQTLFDGGARRAVTDQARAAYDAAVASYRQTVLVAFEDVEDNLAALRILEQEARVQAQAVSFSQQALAFTLNQYRSGIASYLDVLVSETNALNNERTAADILGRRMVAAALLIKALGGGWKSSDLPTSEQAGAR